MDGKTFKLMKDNTQRKILELRKEEAGKEKEEKIRKRTRYLKFLETTDKTRSWRGGRRRNYKSHSTYITLFKARMHSLHTIEKWNRHAKRKQYDDAWRSYLKTLYQDPKCHACKTNAGHHPLATLQDDEWDNIPNEDTMHALNCPSRASRINAANQIRQKHIEMIQEAQRATINIYTKKNRPIPPQRDPQLIVPLVLRTEPIMDAHRHALTALGPPPNRGPGGRSGWGYVQPY